MDQEKVDGLVFSSNFDSGNLQSAERAKDGAWELTIAKDCEGTEFERRSSTWFYFRVRDEREAELSIAKRDKRGARFRFTGMSRQGALYKNGMRPVVRRLTEKRAAGGASCWAGLAGDGGWKRLPTGVCYREQSDRTGDLQFDWNFGTLGEEVEFAFCYPYAYEESLATHDALCAKHAAGVHAPQPPPPGAAPHPPPPKRKNTASAAPPGAVAPKETPQQADERIVLHRELLCFSVEKRRVEMLTITDAFGAAAVRESTLDPYVDVLHGAAAGSDGAPPPVDESKNYDASWLFPEARDGSSLRPEVYPDKPEVLVSARVHPGETPASFVLDGLLELLLRPDDRRAKLRRAAWRFVPQLNPDGVARGHYRHDVFGVNLNRVYWPRPDHRAAPAQAALMVLARAASCQPAGLALFVDLHAHATKRGVFIYGNHIDDEARQVENKLYALLLAVNSSFFDYNACNFSREHMLRRDRADAGGASAEGAARVAVLRYTGLDRAYTLECNYNSGRLTNHVPAARGEGANRGASPERPATLKMDSYTPDMWREVGRALGAALLDAFCENPWDRVGSSRWKSVDVMRQWLGDHPRKVNGRPRRKSRPTLTVADTNGGPTLLLPRRKAAFT
ncbi:hypothetical protein JL722_2665 [Aureococcus anophagefferens]|nr:hypothetical protein JL722_2665 [Aureococcus anophagefferens]